MSVLEISEPSSDQSQLATYNSNIGGGLKLKNEFLAPADVNYAIVGLVLVDGATAAGVASTLVPDIEALTEVTSVNGDQVFGQTPASVPTDFETTVNVQVDIKSAVGTGGDTFSNSERKFEKIKPPNDKKWVVVNLRVPTDLDALAITALESALEGITGVTTAEHLVSGFINSLTVGNANIVITTHVRIDPIPV